MDWGSSAATLHLYQWTYVIRVMPCGDGVCRSPASADAEARQGIRRGIDEAIEVHPIRTLEDEDHRLAAHLEDEDPGDGVRLG